MGCRGSATVETAIFLPIVLYFILICLSAFIWTYERHVQQLAYRRKADTKQRRPCDVIRHSEYILELAERADKLINIFKQEGQPS